MPGPNIQRNSDQDLRLENIAQVVPGPNIQRNFDQDLQLENIAQVVPGHEQTFTVPDVKKRRRSQIGLASQLGLDL